MLKATAAVTTGLVFALATPAAADFLLTGEIRDRLGVAVEGARVTAFDAFGRRVGADRAQGDGTFAIAAQVPPAEVGVSCDYCRGERVRVEPGQPLVIIVERYSAVMAAGPSAADIGALPFRSAADIASLRPFTVVAGNRISDRALDYEGAVLVDGLPFYSAGDGSEYGQLVAAHAVAALTALPPAAAPVYGGYADAGAFDIRLRDADGTPGRVDTGDASDGVLRFDAGGFGAGYAASTDADDDRQAADADGTFAVGSGQLSFSAVDLTSLTDRASGAGLTYATESRRFATFASAAATQSSDSSYVTADVRVRERGPLGLTFGARASRATSSLAIGSGVQFDGGVYAAAGLRGVVNSLDAIVAYDRGGDGGLISGTGAVEVGSAAAALVGSLADDVRLDPHWSAHAGIVSNLRIPTFTEVAGAAPLTIGGDRSLLFEQSVTYEDLRRLRVAGVAYTQHASGSAEAFTNGIGIDAAWQIAPQLVLRGWLLRANQTALPVLDPSAPYSPYTPTASAVAITRQLVWLSYGAGLRVDALVRGGGLEGDVRIPLGSHDAFALGSAAYNGRRTTTFGLTLR